MKMSEFIAFFKDKNEHYEISDAFAKDERYVQKRGGYIAEAKRRRLETDRTKAEPNQRWHLTVAYSESTRYQGEARGCYRYLKCPELLLWMAEAAGVEEKTVQKAAAEAKRIIDGNETVFVRNTAGGRIKELIPWEMIEEKIQAAEKRQS